MVQAIRCFLLLILSAFLAVSIAPNMAMSDDEMGNLLVPTLSPDIPTFPTTVNGSFVQQGLDYTSWRTFVALNWPASDRGEPSTDKSIEGETDWSATPRVWEFYKEPQEVFLPYGISPPPYDAPPSITDEDREVCRITDAEMEAIENKQLKLLAGGISDERQVDSVDYLQPISLAPLVDRKQNFVVYETRINEDEFDYIIDNKLYNFYKQMSLQPGAIDLPAGSKKSGSVGAIELKASWRIIAGESEDVKQRYYTKPALIYVDAEETIQGKPLCLRTEVGLVGFHIVQKFQNLSSQIWSTFEQVDNLKGSEGIEPSFAHSKPSLKERLYTNEPPGTHADGEWLWNTEQPFAHGYNSAQIKRSQPIENFARGQNRNWQQTLRDSVWQYYQLVGTQWQFPGEKRLPPSPPFLANSTIESYIQRSSSCIGCHRKARSVNQEVDSDFNYLLRLAQPPTSHS